MMCGIDEAIQYIEKIVQFYPELKDKILKICRGSEAEQEERNDQPGDI